jgi:hypothetical protein
MVIPALPPWVPWQPAQALESIAALGPAADATPVIVIAPIASANRLHLCFIFVSSCRWQ